MYFNGSAYDFRNHYRNSGMKQITKRVLAFSLCFCILFTSFTTTHAYTIKVNSTKYGYSTLSTSDKKMYKKILNAVNTMSKEVVFDKYKKSSHLLELYKIVLADNPDIFWVDQVSSYKYTQNKKIVKSSLGFKYSYSKKKKESEQKKIESRTNQILKNLPNEDDYEKAKYLYAKVAELVQYNKEDISNSNNQQILSALLYGESVCAGYAKMYTYLLQKAGLQAMYVTGKARGQGHAWTLVKISNQYYYSDVTWGDNENIDLLDSGEFVNYTYFLEPLSDMSKDHVLDKQPVKMPKIENTDYEYFRYEGLYFTKFTKAERAFVDEQLSNGKDVFQIKCNNETVLNAFRNYIYKGNILGISFDDDRFVMTVFCDNFEE